MVDEEGNTPRQVKSENLEDDEQYPSTSNQIHDEEETHEAPEEQIRIEEKTPSRISNFGAERGRCTNKKNHFRSFKLSSVALLH